jgi:cell division protein FtsI (penicillin-binding protein 3)
MGSLRSRLLCVAAVLGLSSTLVVGRLVLVQVIHRGEYSQRSRQQSLQREVVKAPRGRILDRRGRELATTVAAAARFAAPEGSTRRAGRTYPHGELAASLLGFVGTDGYGLGGAELAFDKYLRGEDGWTIVQRDARLVKGRQQRYHTVGLPSKAPTPGADVYLTIDLDIQGILQSVLRQTRDQYLAKGAMGMVMEPSSGRILAMDNVPSFDPNNASRYSLEERVNRCIGDNYEPGSTFKLVTATAVLEEGLFTEDDTLDASDGVYTIYGESIRDHERLGRLSFAEALAHSSNVCFAKMADKLGNEPFYRYTRNFGFGEPTGLALPGEEAGIVHPIREWSGRTRVTMAMGQEVMATLVQMMTLYATVANDGVMVQPRVCDRISDVAGYVLDSSRLQPVRRVASRSVCRRLKSMLTLVVDKGTGAAAAIKGVRVAGKTGTSQKLDHATAAYSDSSHDASFIGFVPADAPALLCGIVVDEPEGVRLGGLVAAPAFRRVVEQIMSQPDLEYAEAILHPGQPATQEEPPRVAKAARADKAPVRAAELPFVSGLPLAEAKRLIGEAGLRFEVLGSGDSVMHQSPQPGCPQPRGVAVRLYTVDGPQARVEGPQAAVPDCRGRDLREALNMLNVKGIAPYVKGAGVVKHQSPAAGVAVARAAACTLYCAFGI